MDHYFEESSLQTGLFNMRWKESTEKKQNLHPLDDSQEKEANDYIYHRFMQEDNYGEIM